MPTIRLTKRAVEAIENVDSGQCFHWDTQLTGFGVKATKSGKSYVVEGQVNRKRRRYVIGNVEVFALEQARKRAQSILVDMANGIDPNQRKRGEIVEAITVAEAFENFFKMKSGLAENTITDYRRTCDKYLVKWANRPLVDITRQLVLTRHRKLSEENGETTANSVFRYFRSVYNFTAATFDDFPANPVTILTQARAWNKQHRRQTVVPANLLPAWWKATIAEDATTRDILLTALFTGMRRSEITAMSWDNVDVMNRSLTIPKTKNGDPLTLPLSEFLCELFRNRRKLTGNSPWIFPSDSAAGHIQETKKMVARVSTAINHRFTMHDLRRTYITIAESLDIPHYALKRLLNHRTDNDITGGYIVMNVERLREPVERVATRILELTNG
jgi:integrase